MINGLKEESINRGATALMDKEVDSFGVPNPRILIVGCGGSGNNTLNRITHLGVEGAVTVAINTDKQHLDHTRALQKLLVGRHITRGLGAGGDPSTGRRCAEAGREMIKLWSRFSIHRKWSWWRFRNRYLSDCRRRSKGCWRAGCWNRNYAIPRRTSPENG